MQDCLKVSGTPLLWPPNALVLPAFPIDNNVAVPQSMLSQERTQSASCPWQLRKHIDQ